MFRLNKLKVENKNHWGIIFIFEKFINTRLLSVTKPQLSKVQKIKITTYHLQTMLNQYKSIS